MEIIFATKNTGKLKEIALVMKEAGIELISMAEAGMDIDIPEVGETFMENALTKAETIAKISKRPAMADDSGLEIDYMDKLPGVHSALYLGVDTPYSIRNKKILDMLKDVPFDKRTARFVCVMAYVSPEGKVLTAEASMDGYIAYEEKGENGFGYDPIFFLPEYNMTSAELTTDEKNKISHRGKALRLILEKIILNLS